METEAVHHHLVGSSTNANTPRTGSHTNHFTTDGDSPSVTLTTSADGGGLFRSTPWIHFDRTGEENLLRNHYSCFLRGRNDTEIDDLALSHEYHQKASDLLLITGPEGCGKSTLAYSLAPIIKESSGFLLKAKLENIQIDSNRLGQWQQELRSPYAPFISAFTDLVASSSNSTNQALLLQLRENLQQNLTDDESKLILQVVPGFGSFLGMQQEVTENTNIFLSMGSVGPSDGHLTIHTTTSGLHDLDARFRHAYCRFVAALCSRNTSFPLVLLVDDLHKATAEVLQLLSSLLTDSTIEAGSLWLVGTCCPVSMDHPLSSMLRNLEDDADVEVSEIPLKNLTLGQVETGLLSSLGLANEQVLQSSCDDISEQHPLALFLYERTQGNLFFLQQSLHLLVESGAVVPLARDSSTDDGLVMTWNTERLRALELQQYRDEVDWVTGRIRHLPQAVQDLLKTASCIGLEFDREVVDQVVALTTPTDEVYVEADQAGFIQPIDSGDSKSRRYSFSHNKIQLAAYALLPDAEREGFHAKIGRRLWRAFRDDPQLLETHAFLIVEQLKRGRGFLQDDREKTTLASICLIAGKQEEKRSSFRTAAFTFQFGLSLLDSRSCWRDQYDLSLALHNAAAEAEQAVGEYDAVDQLVEAVLRNARSTEDKLVAYTARIHALGSRSRLQDAVDQGLEVLEMLNERIPLNASWLQIRFAYWKTSRSLRSLSDDQVLALPNIANRQKLAAMQIMNFMFSFVFTGRTKLAAMIALRMVQISLRFGMCAVSAFGFGMFGSLLCVAASKFTEANRYAEIALRLVVRFGAREWIPRVHLVVFSAIRTNTWQYRDIIEPLSHASRIGLITGDHEYALRALSVNLILQFFISVPLEEVQKRGEEYRSLTMAYQQDYVYKSMLPVLQMVANLQGKSEDPVVFNGRYMQENETLAQARADKNLFLVLQVMGLKALVACILNQYSRAEPLLREVFLISRGRGIVHYRTTVLWLEGLTLLGLARRELKFRRTRLILIATKCLNMLKKPALYAPGNLLHRVYFLEAEIAFTKGKIEESIILYKKSSKQAASQRLISEQAMILEHAGLALCQLGRVYEGLEVLHQSRFLYHKWGCTIKVEQMKSLSPRSSWRLEGTDENVGDDTANFCQGWV